MFVGAFPCQLRRKYSEFKASNPLFYPKSRKYKQQNIRFKQIYSKFLLKMGETCSWNKKSIVKKHQFQYLLDPNTKKSIDYIFKVYLPYGLLCLPQQVYTHINIELRKQLQLVCYWIVT